MSTKPKSEKAPKQAKAPKATKASPVAAALSESIQQAGETAPELTVAEQEAKAYRDALIAQKREIGLSKRMATQAADKQIAHDAALAAKTASEALPS